MRVLLIQPPYSDKISLGCARNYSTEARSPLPPLGLLYLAGHLKKNHDVKVLDMPLSKQSIYQLESTISDFEPDLIGVSVLINSWPVVIDILNWVKWVHPEIVTVVGGSNVTQYLTETISHENVDFAIAGLGQFPLMELCNRLDKDKSGAYCSFYPSKIDDFEFLDREATPFNEYFVGFCPENPTTTMISSTGCPFHCAFCDVHNQQIEIRDADHVVDEMEAISRMGIRSILFNDELFTIDPRRVKQICKSLIERKVKVHWSVKSRIDCIQSWILELMREAGCFNIHFGIESGNDFTLDRMKKGFSVSQIRYAVQAVKDVGMSCTGNFMLGYPGESEEDILNTIDFAKSLNLNLSQFSITMDTPNTELFDEAVAFGRRHGDHWREFTRHPERTDLVEMFSSELSREKLFELLDEAHSNTRTLYNIGVEDGSRRSFYHGNV